MFVASMSISLFDLISGCRSSCLSVPFKEVIDHKHQNLFRLPCDSLTFTVDFSSYFFRVARPVVTPQIVTCLVQVSFHHAVFDEGNLKEREPAAVSKGPLAVKAFAL